MGQVMWAPHVALLERSNDVMAPTGTLPSSALTDLSTVAAMVDSMAKPHVVQGTGV